MGRLGLTGICRSLCPNPQLVTNGAGEVVRDRLANGNTHRLSAPIRHDLLFKSVGLELANHGTVRGENLKCATMPLATVTPRLHAIDVQTAGDLVPANPFGKL